MRETGLWKASKIDNEYGLTMSSGFEILDKELPGLGWPQSGVTEVLYDRTGIGELKLMMPAISRLSRSQNRWIALIDPPHIPYAPALEHEGVNLARLLIITQKTQGDYLWALEKSISSKSCRAVIAWPNQIKDAQVRRLQVASREGNCWTILLRSERLASRTSPAELRVRLRSCPSAESTNMRVKILKRHGSWQSPEFKITLLDKLHQKRKTLTRKKTIPISEKANKKKLSLTPINISAAHQSSGI